MANVFDFQLKADDQVSQSIQNIDDAVKKLTPQLNDAQKVVQLGGRRSAEGLDEVSGRLEKLAKNARDGVQFVGDLVPPLKMVGGLTLGLGGLATVLNGVKSQIKEYADSGYKIDTTAKNISATTRAYQELTGAMIENGATRDSAESSVTGLYQRANDALNGRDDPFNALMAQMGIKISKTKEGMADVVKLMDDLNRAMLKQTPARQSVIAQVGQFSPDLLNYLRQSTEQVQRLKDQAQRDGLIFSDKDVQNALEFHNQVNQISASWDGMLMKGQAWLGQAPIVQKSFDDASQIMQHGFDAATVGSLMTWNRGGKQADRLRDAQKNDAFKKTLSWDEKLDLRLGYASGDLVKKLNSFYGPTDRASQLQQDVQGLYVSPPNSVQQPGTNGPLFSQLESKYKLPQGTLNNVYQAESAGGKYMFSPAGAEGPFQFMPATGQQYGLNNRADRMDTGKSAEAAAHYLSDLLAQFGGDMKKAVAAYNWGPGRVSSLGLNYAPKETRDYLNRVMPGLPDFYDVSTISDPLVGDDRVSDNNVTYQGAASDSGNSINSQHEPNINTPTPGSAGAAGGGISAQQVADVLSKVLKDNKSEIELTLINDRTGERRKISGSGGKVTTAMPLP
ncbi:lytic transglycosylase domain-containing protein [Rahnella sp. NRRL B-41462]|uniref:lytic transglycosylase domain-containing protein n=1 Tax=Rahnella sp. NRRL B-41462 TaxID=1610579 RepID=UPI000DD40E0B|nr:lytic transglycosylase domain-containing protein [Rahnella sp. NRRL B-41462]